VVTVRDKVPHELLLEQTTRVPVPLSFPEIVRVFPLMLALTKEEFWEI
jgi:hypothetical protein